MLTQETIDLINRFVRERDWEKFHTGDNLAKSLVLEASELLELYQWSNEVKDIEKLKEELADVIVHCIMISEKYGFDIDTIIKDKMEKNAKKYPVSKAFGNSKKYDEF